MESKDNNVSLIPIGWEVNPKINPNYGDQISNAGLFESYAAEVQAGRRSVRAALSEMEKRGIIVRANSAWK